LLGDGHGNLKEGGKKVGLQSNGMGLGKLTSGEGWDRRLRVRWWIGGEKRGGVAGDA